MAFLYLTRMVLEGIDMSDGIVVPKGRILVKEIEVERQTAGGIILAGDSDPENKARFGEIVSHSIMVDNHKNSLYKEGGKIYFGKFAGARFTHEGDDYLSLLETEVVAVVL